MVIGSGRDRLDVAGPEPRSGDAELALDHGGVGDDLLVELQHDMRSAKRVFPVGFLEPLLIIVSEGRGHEGPDRRDLVAHQVLGRETTQAVAIGGSAGSGGHGPILDAAASPRDDTRGRPQLGRGRSVGGGSSEGTSP